MKSDNDTHNLLITQSAQKFNNWLYNKIRPYLYGNILEIGSGLGVFSEKILTDFPHHQVIISDINQNYLHKLKRKFRHHQNAHFLFWDLSKIHNLKNIEKNINTIIILNVLEHIQDDHSALKNAYNILKQGGIVILLVPCHQFLFNSLDITAKHYRRYTKKELSNKIIQAGFKIKKTFYFNFFAIPGWFTNGNIFKKAKLNLKAMRIFDRLVPYFAWIEKYILKEKIGISLVAILKK